MRQRVRVPISWTGVLLAALTAALVFAGEARAAGHKIHNLAPGVFVMEMFYSNSPFIITDEGVLVMDTYRDWGFYKEFRDLNIMAVYHSIDMGF